MNPQRAQNRAPGWVAATGHLPRSTGLPADSLRVLGAYAVVYLLAGTGRYSDADGRSVTVNAGDLIIVLPDVGHTYGPPPGQTWDQLFVVFAGPVFDIWRASGLFDPAVRHVGPNERLAREFSELVASPMTGLKAAARLQLLLADVLTVSDADADYAHGWLAQALAIMDADIRRERPLHDIAATLHMSYDSFRKRFRRLAGVSPARYRSQQAIDRACQLMIEGALTDRQIAIELGFCDEFHFSHRFRQLTGRSPRQFRSALPQPATSPP